MSYWASFGWLVADPQNTLSAKYQQLPLLDDYVLLDWMYVQLSAFVAWHISNNSMEKKATSPEV